MSIRAVVDAIVGYSSRNC